MRGGGFFRFLILSVAKDLLSYSRKPPRFEVPLTRSFDCARDKELLGLYLLLLTSHFSLIALPYRPPEADLAIVDAQIEAAVWIGAHPGLVGDGSAFAAVVGKWNQSSLRALLAARPFLRLHIPPGWRVQARRRAGPAIRTNPQTRRQTGIRPQSRTRYRLVG